VSRRFTDPQKGFIQKIERSIERLNPLISEARMLRLFLIERELNHCREGLMVSLEHQRRAYLDDSLTSREPLLITGLDKSR
jgi:hypothetical protein